MMGSVSRSIKRGIIFGNMNKQQRTAYRSATPEGKKEFERELAEKLKAERKLAGKEELDR